MLQGILTYDQLVPLALGKDVPCPICAGRIGNPKKPVLRVWLVADFGSYYCARCDAHGWARPKSAGPLPKIDIQKRMREADLARMDELQKRIAKARWIWDQGKLAHGTIVSGYLLRRGIKVCPSTLRFLPSRNRHPPAMLAAFGMPIEPVPGTYVLGAASVQGVHITRLKPDGSDKAPDDDGRTKIMVGPSNGWPIALIPPNDQGGLAIAEGIETALSMAHTGLGIWAAGSAARMPALAPQIAGLSCIDTITIAADADEHGEGLRRANELADKLCTSRPDIDVKIATVGAQ